MIQSEYSKAFSQLSEIIKNMKKELREKIPSDIIDAVEKAKDENYIFKCNPDIPLNQQDLFPETKSLLSIIYSDYLCDESKRKKWMEYDRFEAEILEKIKKSKNSNEIFNNNANKSKEQVVSNTNLVVKEKWYVKIFKKIKGLFIRTEK